MDGIEILKRYRKLSRNIKKLIPKTIKE